jgi:hypothetical protein
MKLINPFLEFIILGFFYSVHVWLIRLYEKNRITNCICICASLEQSSEFLKRRSIIPSNMLILLKILNPIFLIANERAPSKTSISLILAHSSLLFKSYEANTEWVWRKKIKCARQYLIIFSVVTHQNFRVISHLIEQISLCKTVYMTISCVFIIEQS